MSIQRLFIILVLPVVLLLGPVVVAQTDDDLVAAADDEGHRQLQTAVPLWWEEISSTYDGEFPLQRCSRRSVAPVNNSRCGRKAKTCFFGTQECGSSPLPETECSCDGSAGSRTWTCEAYPCDDEPETRANGCPVDGFEVYNDPACPEQTASGECMIDGLSCRYGNEGCCGWCSPQVYATCEVTGFVAQPSTDPDSPFTAMVPQGQWVVAMSDSNCGVVTCDTDRWPDLIGTDTTCDAAKVAILAKYPKMIPICLSETEPMPTTDDYDRYIIVTDATTGFVTAVVYNRNADDCPTYAEFNDPAGGGDLCTVRGSQCKMVERTDTIEKRTECICNGYRYDQCLSSLILI